MQKFIFKFDPLIKLKEAIEKKLHKEISEINDQIINCEEKSKQIILKKAESQNTKNNISVSELKFRKDYIRSLELQWKNLQMEIEELIKKRETKKNEMVQRMKEKKIFQKLEEIHHESFNDEQKKIESAFINEIAVQKYARTVEE